MRPRFLQIARTALGLLVCIASFLSLTSTAFADVTNISYGSSGSVVGTFVQASDSDFTLFTPLLPLTSGSTVTLTFPSGTTLTTAAIAASDFRISQATQGLCTNAGSDTAPSSISSNSTDRTITLTLAAGSLSTTVLSAPCGLGVVTIKTSGTLGGTEIQHPTTVTTTGTYQITTSIGDTGSISNVSFVHGAANKLDFSLQPSSTATAGIDFGTQPRAVVQDQYGNTVTSDSSTAVTLAAVLASDGTTAGGGTLNATSNPVTASSGIAIFAGVDYTKAEAIKLRGTASGLTAGLSTTVTVSAGAATQLIFTTQPSSIAFGGTNFSTQPVVTVRDAFNNTITDSTASITLAAVLASDGTTAGAGTLNATSNPLSASSGVATFAGMNYTVGENIKLKATSTGLSNALSTAVSVTAAAVSGISATPGDTSASMSWTSNTPMSTQIEYGLTASYGSSTSEIDTSPRVTSHSQSITGLVSCSTFHYRVKSTAAGGNTATSSDGTFATTSCVGSATIEAETAATITTASGGSVSLLSSGVGAALTVPSGFSGGDAQFQIKRLASASVISAAPAPSNNALAGNHTYDFHALSSPTTAITSFSQPITVIFTYSDAQISDLDESSLRIYRWNGSSWNLLTGCSVNSSANSVTCSTTAFSTFGLFGGESPDPTPTPTPAPNTTTSSQGFSAATAPSCTALRPGAKAPWIYAAIPVSDTTIQLYFTEPDGPYDRLALAYGRGKIEYGSDNIGGSGLRSFIVRDLLPKTEYVFRIRAGNNCAPGNWSNDVTAKTTKLFAWHPLSITQSEVSSVSCQDTHTVESGDTLWEISERYFGSGLKAEEIRQRNLDQYPTLSENDRLQIDWQLHLPCYDSENTKVTDNQANPARKYALVINVVDTLGKPIPRAKVFFATNNKLSSLANDQGEIRFANVSEGQHTLLLQVDDYSTTTPVQLSGDVKEIHLKLVAEKESWFISPTITTWFLSAFIGIGLSIGGLSLAKRSWFTNKKMLP